MRGTLSGAALREHAGAPPPADDLPSGRHAHGAGPLGGGSNPDPTIRGFSRREFLAAGSILGWLPFLRPKHIELAGARFRIVRNGNVPRRYLLIHGNEESAREVLTRHMQAHEGIAYLIENHTREVAIEGGKLDPNRMFSRLGAQANLKQLNRDWPPERIQAALALLDRGREKLVRALTPPAGGLTIALHNNSAGYSVANEEPISDAGSIREPDNPHAFLLCDRSGRLPQAIGFAL